MSVRQTIIISCFVLLALGKLGDSLRCFECTSCNGPVNRNNTKTSREFNGTEYSCWKLTARGVATARGISNSCVELNAGGFGTWCCKTDLCNGAILPVPVTYLVLLMAFGCVTLFFKGS
ncbi:unnamed protein product [Rotaria socialis]|uniref:Protein quiver n=1 Tax=Rotaria socialis TaxID=392032 RepID=A0A820ZA02_9BILA|nr:unnamed protein product [Rotaria socialis]CAF4559308.1 unnamed protein product [Rotaria socialis]